jgi:hypothetical protein
MFIYFLPLFVSIQISEAYAKTEVGILGLIFGAPNSLQLYVPPDLTLRIP